MKICKPTPDEFDALLNYLNASELALERAKFSFDSPEDNWLHMDDEDLDKKNILKIQKNIAKELGISIEDVDNRIVMYEFLQEKFNAAFRWRGVYWTAEVLLENIQDPFDDCLAFHPCFEQKHVANEQ